MARWTARRCDRCQTASDVAWYGLFAHPAAGACGQRDIGTSKQHADLCGGCMSQLAQWFDRKAEFVETAEADQ